MPNNLNIYNKMTRNNWKINLKTKLSHCNMKKKRWKGKWVENLKEKSIIKGGMNEMSSKKEPFLGL